MKNVWPWQSLQPSERWQLKQSPAYFELMQYCGMGLLDLAVSQKGGLLDVAGILDKLFDIMHLQNESVP